VELVERQPFLERLGECLDEARAGSGRLVLVGGEAGIGKTSLARAFVGSRAGRVRVLWGACDPLSTPRPLAPFHDMPPIAALLERQPGRYELLTELLDELSLHTLLVAEDLHWADEATLDALRFIGRRVTGTRSVVLATYRDDELGSGHPLRAVLGDLATAPGCERLHVPPLSTDGVRALAAGHALDPERIHRITGGNPFYVSEVLAAPGWTVPASVADAVLARVSRLSSGGRALVDLVSLAPGGLEPEIADGLLDGAGGALDEAVERGVLVETGPRVSFRHELARLALESAVPVGRRRRLHGKLLDALEARSADPARLAHHADAAGAAGRVLRYAAAAAREASARGSHREAARQYERAVGYAEGMPPAELADLLSLWAEERVGFHEPAHRIELLERIADLRRQSGDELGLGEALTLLSLTVWGTGRSADAFELVRHAVELLEPLPPGRELAYAYAASSLQEMLARNGREAVRWGERAIELAERTDARVALHMALNAVGAARLVCFEDPEGARALERSARLASASGDDFAVGRALGNLGSSLGELRQYEQAAACLEKAVAFDEDHDLDGLGGYAKSWLAKVRFEQGRWIEADRLAEEALRFRDVMIIISITALCVRGRIRVRLGDATGDALLAEAWELAARTGDVQRTWPVAAGRAESAWLAGRAEAIPELVRPTFDQARALGVPWAIGELGFWLSRARALDAPLEGAAEPYALQASGDWRRAVAAWKRIGAPYEHAEALADGDEAALREALSLLTRLGAEPAADQVRERMRRAGLKRVPARPRASTRDAPAQLTRRQLEVLALVENGLSNAEIASRLFISEKTAGHHVSAILRKLGAGSRGEAAAAARKLGIAATRT
jgi:DNA-binding CsgD family transcriptional regulator/tetratricopeptide (TPR) repeat protein